MAKTVKEELTRNDIEHNNIMEKINAVKDELKEDIKNLSIEVAKLPEKMLEKTDQRYASKTVEKVVYAVIGAVGLALVYWIIDLLKNS